ISVTLLLIGCQREITYDYLIDHLSVLKQEIRQCEELNNTTSSMTVAQKNKCEIIIYTAANVVSQINEQQDDPQQFGKKIMQVENDYTAAKDELYQFQQDFNLL